jgi:hypothetical protein
MKLFRVLGKYIGNVAVSIDQLGNTLLGGAPDETISSRIGKIKVHYGGRIPWKRPIARIVDKALDKIDPNHCIDSIEIDEGHHAIVDQYRLKVTLKQCLHIGKEFWPKGASTSAGDILRAIKKIIVYAHEEDKEDARDEQA